MTAQHSTWDEVRRLADEVQVKIHLAGMDVRDRWNELEPRLAKLERAIVQSSERTVAHEIEEVGDVLRKLRDQIYAAARGDFVSGW